MTKKTLIAIVVIIAILLLAIGAYWYLFLLPATTAVEVQPGLTSGGATGFQPIGRTTTPVNTATSTNSIATSTQIQQATAPLPVLRLLSSTPVGGYGVETAASTTVARWADRGQGSVYEADEDSPVIATISNTTVPRIYESMWNKDLSAFIGILLPNDDGAISGIYAKLTAQSTSTASGSGVGSVAPYALRGTDLPEGLLAYAVSPKKDRLFMLTADADGGADGYVSTFDGRSVTKIFSTPLTQVTASWPTDSVIAIATKGSSLENGYLYFVNPASGAWKKVLGPLPGLSAVVSHDGEYVLLSAAGNDSDVLTSIYSVKDHSSIDPGFRTLADKCAWGNFYTDVVYCAVPQTPVSGAYPEDWYSGALSTVDKIWQADAGTGEVHLVSSLTDRSNQVIDAYHLSLDDKDGYLFFMNKNNLSLWSLDLVQDQHSQ